MAILDFVTNLFAPPWRWVLGGLVMVVLLFPRMLELRASWLDLRIGLRDLDIEKQRQELLKLKYEIEALRKEHDLPELEVVSSPLSPRPVLTGRPPVPATPLHAEPVRKRPEPVSNPVVRWLLDHPALGKPLLWLGQLTMGFLGAMFGMTALLMPIMALTSKTSGVSISMGIFGFILYGILTWGAVAFYLRVRRWRRQDRSAS